MPTDHDLAVAAETAAEEAWAALSDARLDDDPAIRARFIQDAIARLSTAFTNTIALAASTAALLLHPTDES